jgi:type I restriction enzyme, S subunit
MKDVLLLEIAEVTAGQGAPQDPSLFTSEGEPFVRAGSLDRLLKGWQEDDLEKINDNVARDYTLFCVN